MSASPSLSGGERRFITPADGAAQEFVVYQGLASLPPGVQALFREAALREGFFMSLPWLANLAAHGGLASGGIRLYTLGASEDEPRLLLPLLASSGRLGVRTLSALTNWYSSFYAPLLRTDANASLLLPRMLHRIVTEGWDRIDLRPMDVDSPSFAALEDALRAAGMAAQRYFCFINWYLQVDGRSYAEYAGSLPSPLRNTLKRKEKSLARSGRASFRIVTGVDEADLEAGIAAYEAIYRNSWKSPEPTPAFMPALIRLCAREGWLRLGLAHVDGEPAAAQLWIVCDGVASIYKLAYDERYAALSIGSLLTARMMEHAIDVDRVREVDYLTGDDAYKRDWMSHSRERWGLVAYNLRSARGLALAAINIGGGKLKRLLRGLRGG